MGVVTTIGALTSMFGLIYVLTAGGPGTSTTLPEFLIWLEQGKMNRPGYAAAISMLLFSLMAGLAYVQIRIMSKNADPLRRIHGNHLGTREKWLLRGLSPSR